MSRQEFMAHIQMTIESHDGHIERMVRSGVGESDPGMVFLRAVRQQAADRLSRMGRLPDLDCSILMVEFEQTHATAREFGDSRR